MAWNEEKPYQKIAEHFDFLLPGYTAVEKAPTFEALLGHADRTGRDIDEVMQVEAQALYKAIKSSTGDVYLMQNPALASYQAFKRADVITRKVPKLELRYADAKEQIRKATKKRDEQAAAAQEEAW